MILESDEIDDEELDDNDNYCPLADDVISAVFFPKPFGLAWDGDVMCNFLKKLGYKIIDGSIAIKPGEKDVPEKSNLIETFNTEVQRIMTKWLLKIDSES